MTTRHRWGDPVRFERKTERECSRGCRTIKVTRHEGGLPWQEFWRDGEIIARAGEPAPPCAPVEVPA